MEAVAPPRGATGLESELLHASSAATMTNARNANADAPDRAEM
jgi:hypothetical protein